MLTYSSATICLLAFVCFFKTGDAAITDWTTPTINGAADGTGTLSVDENQALDTAIETYVAVTDATSITYALGTAVSPFALSTGGELTITAALDHETTSTYTLEIVATDDGGAAGTATITVTVNDINEVDPVFSPASYSPCIQDGSVAGVDLTQVTATDADSANTITYGLGATGNTGTAFKIDSSSGLIEVNTGPLDRSTTASYSLQVTAADSGSPVKTATVTVSVTVEDSCTSNNNAVAFTVSMMMFCVTLFAAVF